MSKQFYITTPIYYVNSVPHVGHALTMLVCDVSKRYREMRGDTVTFLTGTDENGLKVMEAAVANGEDPHAFVARISQTFVDCWKGLNFEYDDFIRTTEPRHVKTVQHLFALLQSKGHIYQDKYVGWYDVGAETFVKESELVDGKSPDGNEVRWVEEENYFFRLSSFSDRLLEKIETDPTFLLPSGRRAEVISFIKQGLRDVCVSRANPGWGIPIPGDESKVVYVWFDALVNYLSATGWPDDGYTELWPADVHWMAKEIFTRFHATLWPAMLMAAELPLPKTVIAHGWFTFGESGDKMSKSKGNVILPLELRNSIAQESGCAPELAVDVVRFCLARFLPYEGDTNFNREEVNKHYNSDLANDLGNALNRSLSMAHKFVGGIVPTAAVEAEALTAMQHAKTSFEKAMELHKINEATEAALNLIRFLNKYIDTRAPWALAKSSDPSLEAVIRSMLEILRTAEGLFRPIMPATALQMAAQLNHRPLTTWEEVAAPASLTPGQEINPPQPLFPRLELVPQPAPKKTMATPPTTPPPAPAKPSLEKPTQIDFADFMKVDIRVARILEAEPIAGSEKLMKLQVSVGDERRQIVAGIQKKYSALDLIGRQIVVVYNLKPVKLMGQESQGMVLAADDADGLAILLQPDSEAPEGSLVH